MTLQSIRALVVASALTLMSSTVLAETEAAPTATVVEKETTRSPLEQTTAWAYDWIVKRVPLDSKIYYEDAIETPEERSERFMSTARDVVAVAFDARSRALFQGPEGRLQTVSLILAIMLHESSFLKHIDYGIGPHARGDSGKSSCMLQVQVRPSGRTLDWNVVKDRAALPTDDPTEVELGYTAEELVASRPSCIRAGARIIRASLGSCSKSKLEDRLALYTSGSCDRGLDSSRNRMRTAIRMFSSTFKDRRGLSDQIVLDYMTTLPVEVKVKVEDLKQDTSGPVAFL